MDPQQIFVDHLRHALQTLQRYIAAGFGAALALLILALSTDPGAGPSTPLTAPLIPLPVAPALARLLLIAVHIGAGFLCYTTVLDAQRIAARIADPQIRAAALSYPTVATSTDPGIRLLGPLAPGIVYAVFLVIDAFHSSAPTFQTYFSLALFGIMPYVGLAYEARTRFAPPPPAAPGNA